MDTGGAEKDIGSVGSSARHGRVYGGAGTGAVMGREATNPSDLADTTDLAFSQAVVADGTLYLSGQPGWDRGFEADEDVASQSRQAFENVRRLLASFDKDVADVGKVTTYLTDPPSQLEAYREAWKETFEPPYPCHTAIGVDQLAREDLLVEVEVEVPYRD